MPNRDSTTHSEDNLHMVDSLARTILMTLPKWCLKTDSFIARPRLECLRQQARGEMFDVGELRMGSRTHLFDCRELPLQVGNDALLCRAVRQT